MKPIEIVELIKQEKPELLGKMPEQKAARIIREALMQISKQVNAVEQGAVTMPGLGNFQVRQVEVKKDGENVTVRRVIFKPAKAKVAAEA